MAKKETAKKEAVGEVKNAHNAAFELAKKELTADEVEVTNRVLKDYGKGFGNAVFAVCLGMRRDGIDIDVVSSGLLALIKSLDRWEHWEEILLKMGYE